VLAGKRILIKADFTKIFSIPKHHAMETTSIKKVDSVALEQKVKKMYSDVALNPAVEYHI